MSNELSTDTSDLGKPVSGFKTSLAKISGALMLAAGVGNVVLGVAALVTGKKVLHMNLYPGSSRAIGTGFVVGGVAGAAFGKAVWDSASSATRTRNYVQLSEKLNNLHQAAQQSRG